MRKLFFPSVLVAIVAVMTSCFEYTEPQFSPSISSSIFYVNPVFEGDSLVSAQDSLDMMYDADADTYDLDTVFIGDTVVFAPTFYTYNSNLMSVEMKWEQDYLDLWYNLTDDITNVLRDTSNVEDGKLYFESGYNRVSFPVFFTPKVQGGLKLKLTVESDSEFPISTVSLYIPAKARAVADSTVVE